MRNRTVKLLSAGALALAAMSGPVQADPAKCQTAVFDAAVQARFPRIREVCLDVVTKDAQDYAVVKGQLVRIGFNNELAHLKPILPDGTKADTMSIPMHPDRKVLVDGNQVLPKDLTVGQTLTFYVKVSEPVAMVLPADNAPLEPLPVPEAETEMAAAPSMPKTASQLPLIGLAGLALLALGGALRRVRKSER